MKFPAILRCTVDEAVFSLKCFAGAMLAFYMASWAGQPRPFWAFMTAYLVAAPLAGMVRSKAVYRFFGTLAGSAAVVLLIPLLANSPELLSLAMALWIALCLYFSLMDRTPRSYAFVLAGITASLIGFPSVTTPEIMFDTASARVEEIGLGIFAATLIHSLVLPSDLTKSILGLLNRSIGDMRQWADDILRRHPESAASDRIRVAADLTQLRILSTHIPYDIGTFSLLGDNVSAIQNAVAALTPSISAADDRLAALIGIEGSLAPDIREMLAEVETWLAIDDIQQSRNHLPAVRQAIATITHANRPAWPLALRIGLATRLDELVTRWQACQDLSAELDHGLRGNPLPQRPEKTQGQLLHLDQGMALLSACSALIATLLCCAFWILTGWPSGAMAATMAAIFSCIFASMDDPVPAIHGFLKWTLWSVPVSAIYVLVLLPMVQDIATLALVCAPVFLFLGAMMGRASTFPRAMPFIIGICGTFAMHDTSQADMVSFTNSMLGQILGIVVAARTTRLLRSVGAAWSARRIQQATWRDLEELASRPSLGNSGEAYLLRALDRIALLAPRVAQAAGNVPGTPVNQALRDLRLGANIVTLQENREHLPAGLLSITLRELANWYHQRISDHLASPSAHLLSAIDTLLNHLLQWQTDATQAAIAALVGLRRNLFPEAPPLQYPASEGIAP